MAYTGVPAAMLLTAGAWVEGALCRPVGAEMKLLGLMAVVVEAEAGAAATPMRLTAAMLAAAPMAKMLRFMIISLLLITFRSCSG